MEALSREQRLRRKATIRDEVERCKERINGAMNRSSQELTSWEEYKSKEGTRERSHYKSYAVREQSSRTSSSDKQLSSPSSPQRPLWEEAEDEMLNHAERRRSPPRSSTSPTPDQEVTIGGQCLPSNSLFTSAVLAS